jgi:triosephosphate isomerase (TIM)
MARLPLIAGNWKMNGLGPGGRGLDGLALVSAIKSGLADATLPCELLVCPPATLLSRVAELLRGGAIALGGQDCHAEPSGAHTGDISAEMLAEAGCRYVILGHSERRGGHGETSEQVRAKIAAAHRAGLVAILCVGETEAERRSGRAFEVIRSQLAQSLPASGNVADIVVAYEPIWAIGSGRIPTLEEIAAVHALIRSELAGGKGGYDGPRVIYGGSVNGDNAGPILALPEVEGALVGSASLKAQSFLAIAQACAAAPR